MKLVAGTFKPVDKDDDERLVKFLTDEKTGEIVSVWVKEIYTVTVTGDFV